MARVSCGDRQSGYSSKKSLVVSSKLLEKTLERYEIDKFKFLGQVKAKEIEGLKCKHPFLDQESLVISSMHVTDEMGTGFVHTAPAHGVDDFNVCSGEKVKVINPISILIVKTIANQ